MAMSSMFAVFVLIVAIPSIGALEKPDQKGYIVFCPCMGRFGNQADQFLGVMNFAKQLDRTLVLPHWVEYRPGMTGSMQIPYDKYFKVEPMRQYHRVILMSDFMTHIAPKVWLKGNRTIFCYRGRPLPSGEESPGCNAKEGNPFGPYWDNFGIDFDHDEFHSPLLWNDHDVAGWKSSYRPDKWPVLAFTGAPAKFPVTQNNARLQYYMQWSDYITDKATQVIEEKLKRPYIGAHLRIGFDWGRACRHVKEGERNHLFASPQCTGYRHEYGLLTEEMCLPSAETVVSQLKDLITQHKAKTVYLARDDTKYDKQITAELDKMSNRTNKIRYYWLPEPDPHVDLAVLARSDYYVGNCVSTFSAFAVRERRVSGKDVGFWAFTPKPHDEL